MTDAMNYYLVAGCFVKNQIRVGMRHDAPNTSLAAKRRGMGITQYQTHDGLNARLQAKRPLRGFQFNIAKTSSSSAAARGV
jgi:hypothetical protein